MADWEKKMKGHVHYIVYQSYALQVNRVGTCVWESYNNRDQGDPLIQPLALQRSNQKHKAPCPDKPPLRAAI